MVDIFKDLQDHGSGILVTGASRNDIVDQYFDTRYILKGKSLEPVHPEQDAFLIAFTSSDDSMAITRELAQYMTNSFGGLIELRVPASQKEKVIETMLEMNYLLEGMTNLEI